MFFSNINVCQFPRAVLKTEAEGRGLHHFLGDLTNVIALKCVFDRYSSIKRKSCGVF